MSDEPNQTTESKAPTHAAYSSRKVKNYNIRIGAGWEHRKGGGVSIQLDAIPLDGRFTLFPISDKPE